MSRCKICDYNLLSDTQSDYFRGLSLPPAKRWINPETGQVECDCLTTDEDDQDLIDPNEEMDSNDD